MGRGNLTQKEKAILMRNPFVLDINGNQIRYSEDFKIQFIQEYYSGKGPAQIFEEAGFDRKILGSKRIERAAARWREAYEAGSLGEPSQNVTPIKKLVQKNRKYREKIEKLERENQLLKEAILKDKIGE